jgi:hypothetical protein
MQIIMFSVKQKFVYWLITECVPYTSYRYPWLYLVLLVPFYDKHYTQQTSGEVLVKEITR